MLTCVLSVAGYLVIALIVAVWHGGREVKDGAAIDDAAFAGCMLGMVWPLLLLFGVAFGVPSLFVACLIRLFAGKGKRDA
jgi:hypothetical protein